MQKNACQRRVKFILNKKIKYYTKEGLRWTGLLVFGILIILLVIWVKFKPVYKVTFLGQEMGMVNSKVEIENAIQQYIESTTEDIAYIKIKEMPKYEFELVDTNRTTNEEQILLAVKDSAIITYKRYAITLAGNTKAVVSTLEEASQVVDDIKEKLNQDLDLDLAITEIYDSNDISVESVETAFAKLNEDEIVQTKLKEKESTVNGVVLHTPVMGTITSRFGRRSSGYHTGLDIATSTGTPIKAVANGIVTYAGWKGSYGNLVIISHGNGVETYYAHCSAIYVSVGQTITTGETISAVGSTGNSTGPHLHLEVRVDGNMKNPQNYLYK